MKILLFLMMCIYLRRLLKVSKYLFTNYDQNKSIFSKQKYKAEAIERIQKGYNHYHEEENFHSSASFHIASAIDDNQDEKMFSTPIYRNEECQRQIDRKYIPPDHVFESERKEKLKYFIPGFFSGLGTLIELFIIVAILSLLITK